jgi:signal transduction histidine kinase
VPSRDNELFDRLVHDLRNPLSVVAYFAEAVGEEGAGAEREQMCARLRANARRALQVLEEFALLGELRDGRGGTALDVCDLAELIQQLALETESTERRPGRVRCQVVVDAPLRLPRAHLACAVRALLRAALRATAPGDALDLAARAERDQVVIALNVVLRPHPEIPGASTLSLDGVEVELAERVAALYGGRCSIEQRPGRALITLTLPARR